MIREVDEAYLAERDAMDQSDRRRLKDGDGDGTSSDVTKSDGLKSRVDTLQVFVALFLAGLIALAVGVMAMANSTNARIDTVQQTVGNLNREVGTVGTKVDQTNQRLERIEQKLDRVIEGR